MRSENYKKGPQETALAYKCLRLLLRTKQLLSPMARVTLLQHFLVAIFFFIYAFICVKTAVAVQKVLLVMPMKITLKSPKENIK